MSAPPPVESQTARLVLAGPEHIPALAEVHARSFEKPWSEAEIARTLQGSGAIGLAAEAEGAIIGFVIARALAGEAEILTLAVRPQQRRLGVARALVEAAAAAALANGAETLWLEVAEDNAAAITLYRVARFETTGRRTAYYARTSGPRADALVMRRRLNTVGG